MRRTFALLSLPWMIFTLTIVGTQTRAQGVEISGTVIAKSDGGTENPDLSKTVVYLESNPALPNAAPPGAPVPQIIQRGKAFIPDLLVVSQGTKVEFPNWDPYSHNVFSRSAAAQFDLDRYPQGQSKSYQFNNVGVVQIFCNIHPQMGAVLLVVPNRFFTRADAQGRFALRDVPPGTYVLVGWGARSGEQKQTLVVPPSGLRGVEVVLAGKAAPEAAAERAPRDQRWGAPGVERGLGVKRERLNLPVVGESHPAPTPQ